MLSDVATERQSRVDHTQHTNDCQSADDNSAYDCLADRRVDRALQASQHPQQTWSHHDGLLTLSPRTSGRSGCQRTSESKQLHFEISVFRNFELLSIKTHAPARFEPSSRFLWVVSNCRRTRHIKFCSSKIPFSFLEEERRAQEITRIGKSHRAETFDECTAVISSSTGMRAD